MARQLNKILLSALLLLPTLLLFWLSNSTPQQTFRGFAPLTWQPQVGCTFLVDKAHSFSLLSRMMTWGEESKGKSVECLSEWFPAKGDEVVIEFAGRNLSATSNVAVALENKEGEIERFDLPRYQLSGVWHLQRFNIDNHNNQELRLRLLDHDPEMGWVSLRNRVNFYDAAESTITTSLRNFAQRNSWLVIALFSSALCYWLFLAYGIAESKPALFFLMLWIAVVTMFARADLFFYMDEWHLMQRLHDHGWSSAFQAHNEHFIPLFFLSYFLQLELFRDFYLGFILISAALLAFAGILCGKVAASFSPRPQAVAPLIAIGFSISALHSETVAWAMVQGALYVFILRSITILGALHYLRTGESRGALVSAIAALLSPLFFGAGLLAFSDVFLVAIFARFFIPVTTVRIIKILAALILPFIIVMTLYATAPNSSVAISTSQPFSLSAYLHYVSLGTILGAITRGLGFWPFAELSSGNQFLAFLASLLAACALFFIPKRFAIPRLLPTLLFGILLTSGVFFLTGIGRASSGPTQALAMRYCSLALLGVCILVLPLLQCLLQLREQKNARHFVALLALLFVSSQVYLTTNFNYYWKQGALTRDFLDQVNDWNKTVGRIPFDPLIAYEAKDTPLAGMMPLSYGGHVQEPSAQISILHPDAMATITETYLERR